MVQPNKPQITLKGKQGVYLNGLQFLHAKPNDFTMLDKLTARGETHVFLIDTFHGTPVTVYNNDDQLTVETVLYEKRTGKALATIKDHVVEDEMRHVTLSPPPGQSVAAGVREFQFSNFQRQEMIERYKQAGEILK